jgi:hypothetical protein
MSTLHRRRRVGDTVTYDINRHSQSWRSANDEPLSTSRELLWVLAAAAALWLVAAGLLAWVLHLLVV